MRTAHALTRAALCSRRDSWRKGVLQTLPIGSLRSRAPDLRKVIRERIEHFDGLRAGCPILLCAKPHALGPAKHMGRSGSERGPWRARGEEPPTDRPLAAPQVSTATNGGPNGLQPIVDRSMATSRSKILRSPGEVGTSPAFASNICGSAGSNPRCTLGPAWHAGNVRRRAASRILAQTRERLVPRQQPHQSAERTVRVQPARR
jgi:hypothetical protein